MRITKWLSGIMIVVLMISSLGVSAAAAEAPAEVETAAAEAAEQAQTAEAAEKSSPAKAEEEPGEDHLTITLYGGDYGYFGSPSVVPGNIIRTKGIHSIPMCSRLLFPTVTCSPGGTPVSRAEATDIRKRRS